MFPKNSFSVIKMSLQFKKKRRNANLRKNDDNSAEDEVSVITDDSKKQKVHFVLPSDV